MHGVRKAMSKGVQIEEVIVWVEAILESMVWKVHDSCPIGVSADSCPAGAPWMRE